MRTLGDLVAYLIEVKLHGLGVGEGQRERRACSPRWADRAEEVGALVALIGGLARSRAAARPLPDNPVLLPDAGFVLKPDLDRLCFGQAGEMGAQRAREVLLKASTIRPSCAGWRGRALIWEKPSSFRSVET